MATLYELSSDYLQVLELPEDEITQEEKQEVLEIIRDEIKNKSINSFYFIRNKESELNAIDDEIKRLRELKEKKTKAIDRFKNYVKECMVTLEQSKLDFGIGSFSLRKSTSTEITDLEKIPKEYLTEKVEIKPNKTEIKKALQNGEVIEGAVLQENMSLQVK